MGVQNVGRVFVGWGGQLTDRPFRLLVYMAMVALDQDADPWFGQGHEVLAEVALGLKLPEDADDWKGRDAVLRKVRRHVTPLLKAGAIETRTRAVTVQGRYGSKHVVYRLFLDGPWKSSPFQGAGEVLAAEVAEHLRTRPDLRADCAQLALYRPVGEVPRPPLAPVSAAAGDHQPDPALVRVKDPAVGFQLAIQDPGPEDDQVRPAGQPGQIGARYVLDVQAELGAQGGDLGLELGFAHLAKAADRRGDGPGYLNHPNDRWKASQIRLTAIT